MRKLLPAVLSFAALAVAANVGFQLAGAIRQVGALRGVNAVSAVSAVDSTSPRAVPRTASVSAATAPAGAANGPPAPAAEPRAPDDEPHVPFDTEAALREAGDRDENVAELMNDPDLAVGSAVRDFLTDLVPAGSR